MRPRIIVLLLTLIVVAVAPGWGQAAPGGALAGLATLQDGVSQRASSSDPMWKSGNADMWRIEVGDTIVLADLEGPGVITHLWNTVMSSEEGYARLLVLRMYWDGEAQPSVEAPLGDFFGVGHGMDVPFQSLPVAVSASGKARNCYWPMPFRKSAKITVTNEGKLRTDMFFSYVDWQKLDALPKDAAYFHAFYRQEFPAAFGKRYHIASISGRGHYVGTHLSVRARLEGWIGEGDDFFYIDGDEEPTLRGTGTEDYFCDAWGFRTFSHPFYGVPLFQGFSPGHKTSVYRWHIADPIRFKESLEAEIEHVGPTVQANGKVDDYGIRPDDFSSVAYWYQEEPHAPFPAMPVGHDRFPPAELTGNPFLDVAAPGYAEMWAKTISADAGTGMLLRLEDDTLANSSSTNLVMKNQLPVPASYVIAIPEFRGVSVTPNRIELSLEPGAEQGVPVTVITNAAAPLGDVTNIPAEIRTTLNAGARGPVTVDHHGVFGIDAPFRVDALDQDIVADGDLGDWPRLAFDVAAPYEKPMSGASWTGPEDCSFRIGVAATDEWLYIAVDVTDDEVVRSTSPIPWGQDGVEVRVVAAPDPERSVWRGQTESGKAILAAMSPKTVEFDQLDYLPENLPGGAKGVCVKTGKGFAAEVAIPVAALDAIQGEAWRQVRVNVAVDDMDRPDEFSQMWWRPDWRRAGSYDGSGTFSR